jgi:hypothetical protein
MNVKKQLEEGKPTALEGHQLISALVVAAKAESEPKKVWSTTNLELAIQQTLFIYGRVTLSWFPPLSLPYVRQIGEKQKYRKDVQLRHRAERVL